MTLHSTTSCFCITNKQNHPVRTSWPTFNNAHISHLVSSYPYYRPTECQKLPSHYKYTTFV